MPRFTVTLLATLAGLTVLGSYGLAAEEAPPPNFLIILADDLGYETLGCYGGQDFATPNLDAMAADGLRLERAYTSPVCTPSRVSFHTGLYTADHGHDRVLKVHQGTKDTVDFSTMPTFAQKLREAGYATATTGKWQLATLCEHPEHIRESGFDSWCVWQIWDCETDTKTSRYWNPFFNRDGVVMDVDADAFGPDLLNAYVIEKMTEATEKGQPFLIVHNMLLPHVPITDTPADRAAGRKGSLASMIAYMDALVGSELAAIDALGIRDNTYVIFIGDNGTDTRTPRHTSSGKVDGGKRDLNDAGTHVPVIIWGPDSVGKGVSATELVDITDIYPTVCELAGVTIPVAQKMRGQSLVPILQGRPHQPRRYVHGGIDGEESVFDGDWRLHSDGSFYDSRKLPTETAQPTSQLSPEAQRGKTSLETVFADIHQGPPSQDPATAALKAE